MFLELIAVVFAGVAAAGVVMLLNRMTGGRLPRWFTPVGAGLAMIGVTIASEYGWYNRTADSLPEGMVIAQTVEKTAFYQPWTYLVPYIDRFVALDTQSLQSNPAIPDQHIAKIYFFGRWAPINEVPVAIDCAGNRRASLADGVEFDDKGAIVGAGWIDVAQDDPILTSVCGAA